MGTVEPVFRTRIFLPCWIYNALKGAWHEILTVVCWYQKKDLEKLEQRGWVLKSTDARARSFW